MNKLPILVSSFLIAAQCFVASPSAQAKDDARLKTARPEKVGMSSERLERIAPIMQSYVDKNLVPGTVTLIARKGKVIHFEAHGYMDAENKTPMRKDAIFRIASMTKPIASVALMMLWEEGRFTLDDPVSKYLPEFANQKVSTTADASGKTGELVDVDRPASIRDMLTHTAGMANNYLGNAEYFAEHSAVKSEDDHASYIERLASFPLNYQPGTQWQYSHATDVVGRLVEVISGQPLDQFLQQRIFNPLDMKDTAFWMEDTKGGRLMSQYTPGEDQAIQLQDPGTEDSRWIKNNRKVPRGAGGLVSTARDYVRFQQAMLNGGELEGVRILSPVTISLMMENHTGDMPLWLPGPGMGFGLGWGVVVDRGAAATPWSLGTAYWGGAYCTLSWIDREQELIGVLMTQVRPYNHLDIRDNFQTLTYQAIVE